jgi:anaerobic selenocysteine-containing dehydrogenase
MSEEKKTESIAEKKISRRSMLKWTTGLAVAGALGIGVGYGASELLRPIPPTPKAVTETSYVTVEKEQVFTNCCHSGPVSVYVRNGRITRIDPVIFPNWKDIPSWEIRARGKTFKTIRSKSLMNSWAQSDRRYVYSPKRLLYPMKRVGYTPGGKGDISNRGKGEFVRISWDEATTLIASEMERLRTTYGLGAIFSTSGAHYQTKSLFTDGIGDVTNRFQGLYAKKGPTPPPYPEKDHLPHGPNWNGSYIGWSTGPDLMFGYYSGSGQIWSPTDLLEDVLQNTDLVVYWSIDDTSTQMYTGYEQSEEALRWIREAGIKTIAITPNLNETAAFHADKWIPIYPGYDIPLAIAITYVWFTENTWAKDWVATHVVGVGVEKYQDYVLGKNDGVPKTPEWAEKICGVKARDIRALARLWASVRVYLYCHTAGANRGWNGEDWARMMTTLQILQGNIGRPGGNMGPTPAAPSQSWPKMPRGRQGIGVVLPADAWPIHCHPHYTVIADSIANPPVTWNGGTTGSSRNWKEFYLKHMYPYEGVSPARMIGHQSAGRFMCQNAWMPDWVRAHMSPNVEMSYVTTIFQEPLCNYLDILLPICTHYERVDIAVHGTKYVVYMQKCIEPLGESVSDLQFYYRLAQKLGFGDQMYNGMTEEEVIKAIFQWSSIPQMGVSWQDFQKGAVVPIPFTMSMDKYERAPALKWFYDQPKGSGLVTPSGMLEIYAQTIADLKGENGNPAPIPKWFEPEEGKSSPLASKYPLIAHTMHFKYRLHSQFDQVSWLRELYKMKSGGKEYEPVWINPQDAQARGIKHGDVIRVFNDAGEICRGEMLASAYLTERIKPGVVRVSYGTWSDSVDPRKQSLDRAGNINSMNTNKNYKNWQETIVLNHFMVQVEKWTGG